MRLENLAAGFLRQDLILARVELSRYRVTSQPMASAMPIKQNTSTSVERAFDGELVTMLGSG